MPIGESLKKLFGEKTTIEDRSLVDLQRGAESARLQAEERRAEVARQDCRTPNPAVLHLAAGVDAAGLPVELVRVPAGEFLMGSSDADTNAKSDEKPRHTVCLAEYYIGKYPVTVVQWRAFVQASERPGDFDALRAGKDNHPVNNVNWDDAVAFCAWASEVSGRRVTLPTEAQWEKAARGTDGRLYPWGNQPPNTQRCNYDNRVGAPTSVGRYSPGGDSPYGCADMAGNVWEWVRDWYAADWYARSPEGELAGPSSGDTRVLRGGGWYDSARYVRAANRTYNGVASRRVGSLGLRVCVAPL